LNFVLIYQNSYKIILIMHVCVRYKLCILQTWIYSASLNMSVKQTCDNHICLFNNMMTSRCQNIIRKLDFMPYHMIKHARNLHSFAFACFSCVCMLLCICKTRLELDLLIHCFLEMTLIKYEPIWNIKQWWIKSKIICYNNFSINTYVRKE
jgi:hypothetical protein